MKDLLRVKFELLTTPLFITLFIVSVINIGFLRVSDILFIYDINSSLLIFMFQYVIVWKR